MEAYSTTMAIRAITTTTKTTFFSSLPHSNSNSSLFNLRTNNPHKSSLLRTLKCLSPNPNPSPNLNPKQPAYSCSAAATLSPARTSDHAPPKSKLRRLAAEFESLSDSVDRLRTVMHYASLAPAMEDSDRVDSNRVMGCTARVWLAASLDRDGKVRFSADSDSKISKGFCHCLVSIFDGASPEEVLEVATEDLAAIDLGLVRGGGERSRANTWLNVFVTMQKKTRALVAERDGKARFEAFPSLVIAGDGIQAKGSYAQAQARFLFPDETKVQELVNVLKEKKIGVVAHFYMDPEVQGVLTAAQKQWPHIHISDSLVMADSAVNMAKAGCEFITVLGVDFMSENVRAILDQAGFAEVGVYRMSNERIGCSLADAAATPSYMSYLEAASKASPSLHVVYINTALETKAFAHELVPTITCTSSNVVQTILQAFAQVPDLQIFYGPDSYMGANIAELFLQMSKMSDEEIAEIHPGHNRNSIKSLLPRLHYYQDGTCIVHHLFGHEVVEKINEMYPDAFLTAHFEVPGEMFSLAMEAKRRGMGVVGSTQNILDFIKQRVQEALDRNVSDHLQFVLGTESGMITSIVAAVRSLLNSSQNGDKVKVEIVFPVSSDSMTKTSSNLSPGISSVNVGDIILPVIPGVASGEGCSIHGGCASCPYMKMNSLSSLSKICQHLPDETNSLNLYKAERFKIQTPNGKLIADVGCEPILHMRQFQASKKLPEELVNDILDAQNNKR